MKTMKKASAVLFVFVLSFSLFVAPGAAFAESGTYVFDEQGLFSSDEFNSLEAKGAELASKYNMGVYFLTTDYMNGKSDPSSSERTDYATAYYKEHHLGLNQTDKDYGDGILFVVAAKSRDYVTVAYGQGSYSFSDKGIEEMEDDVTSELKDNDWFGAAKAYYKEIGEQLEYYAQHGKPQNPIGLFGWLIRIFLIIGLPLIITSFIIGGWRKQMLTAVEQSEAGNYLDRESVVLTRSNDRFINTSIVATPIPKESKSSGGWGGGGGGGFSSSGGGKF